MHSRTTTITGHVSGIEKMHIALASLPCISACFICLAEQVKQQGVRNEMLPQRWKRAQLRKCCRGTSKLQKARSVIIRGIMKEGGSRSQDV